MLGWILENDVVGCDFAVLLVNRHRRYLGHDLLGNEAVFAGVRLHGDDLEVQLASRFRDAQVIAVGLQTFTELHQQAERVTLRQYPETHLALSSSDAVRSIPAGGARPLSI